MEYRMIDCKNLTIDESAIEALNAAGWYPDTTNPAHCYLSLETARSEHEVQVLYDQRRSLNGLVILEQTDERHEVKWLHLEFSASNIIRRALTVPGIWHTAHGLRNEM
jgi:hypothetical protein